MATFRKKEDPLVSCPYNPAHRMLQSRLQLHLVKCQRDHPDADKKVCPYNAKHRISSAEFSHHLVQCEDKGMVEKKIAYLSSDVHRGNTQVPSYTHEVPPSQEYLCWDDEAEVDPYEYKPKTNMLYKDPMILSQWKPAERRKHYQSLGRRNSDEEADEPVSNIQPPGKATKKLKQLRQPKTMPDDIVWSQNEPWQNSGPQMGFGRGFPIAALPAGNRRIAANIFGQAPLDSSLYLSSGLGSLSLGRGNGMLGATSNGFTSPCIGIGDYPPVPPGRVSNLANSNHRDNINSA